MTRKAERARQVRALVRRDGWRCAYCPAELDVTTVTIDHVIPRSRGGTNDLGNLVLACWPCNKSKGNAIPQGAPPPPAPLRAPVALFVKNMHEPLDQLPPRE